VQFSAKMAFSITRFAELIHRLSSENVHNTYPGWRDGYPNLLLPSDNLSTSQAVILALGSNEMTTKRLPIPLFALVPVAVLF
jgi:hypothetical protein